MPLYRCLITDAKGQKKEFIKEAASEEVLTLELIQKNNYPLSIKQVKSTSTETVKEKNFSSKVVIDFTQTMSMLLTSGLSLKDALQIIRTIFVKGPIRTLCNTLDDRIKKGDSFHKALTRFKGSFPPLYIGLVRIGQKVGSLDDIFKKLADYLDKNKKMKGKLKGALTYPILVLSFSMILLVLMMVFIFPRLQSMFGALGADVSDKLNSSMAIAKVFIVALIAIVAGVTITSFIFKYIKQQGGPPAEGVDKFMLSLPLAGKVLFTQEALNFFFAMETLTGSGFSVEDALGEASNVVNNQALKAAILRIKARIIKGEHLSNAFLGEKIFAERIGRWVFIGERSGNIETVFGQLRNYYQVEIDDWTNSLLSIIEPAVIILAGSFVLILIVAFFLPIYSIYGAF